MSDDRNGGTRGPRDDGPVPGLEGLYHDRPLPEALEDRVVADLTGSGLLGAGAAAPWRAAGSRRPRWGTGWFQAAAGLVLFGLGWGAGQVAQPPPPPPATPGVAASPRYMLLLWEGPAFAEGAAAGALAEEYGAWARRVAGSGIDITGDELAPDRELIPPGTGDGPAATLPEGSRLGGYFIVEAATAAQARALAVGHPHGGYGGWIEVAPIVAR